MFASCGMETVHNCAFYGLYNVSSLSIIKSKLTEAPGLHLLKTSLTFLSLFQNQILYLPLDYFSGFKKLESLNLSRNKLISFPYRVWNTESRKRYKSFLINVTREDDNRYVNALFKKCPFVFLNCGGAKYGIAIIVSTPLPVHLFVYGYMAAFL